MFVEVILDYGLDSTEYENPKFYMTINEFIPFLEICSKNDYRVLIRQIGEKEYSHNITPLGEKSEEGAEAEKPLKKIESNDSQFARLTKILD